MSDAPATCWIMTEGIAGTENQCLGVAEAMGVTPVIKRVKLRQPWLAASPYVLPGMSLAFASDSDRLDPPYPDLIIASGRKAISMARHVKKKSGGKSFLAVIQDPRINPRHFDFVAVPQHDPTRGENVMVTRAALHRVTPQKLADALPVLLPCKPDMRVAVLIGGNSKAHRLTPAITEKLCAELMKLADAGVGLFITVSRRTGAANARILQEKLQGPTVWLWDGTGENPYFAYLNLATHIIVTEDSVSMTSEALATGKPVYTVGLEGGGRRLDLFHSLLQEQGFTRSFTGRLDTWSYPPLNDTMDVAQEILHRMERRP